MDMEQEHSDRARYVTEQVALWIENDGDYVDQARGWATIPEWSLVPGKGTKHAALAHFVRQVVTNAKPHSAPWHVKQELAPNDWGRIVWADVADRIAGDHSGR